MVGFKQTKYLICFYCNRKTSTPYKPSIRHFDCPNCDATNYLDEKGEITDPPVATTGSVSSSVQYAVPQSASPQSSKPTSTDNFCDTCLKNQRLFAASLAQYLPGDPDAPDYAALEKTYYKFRNDLEERYPQICSDCEPRVRQRMEQAAYTAKTDTLRRMIDRSRNTQQTRTKAPLDYAATLGRWLWLIGLTSQLLWHISMLRNLGEDTRKLDGSLWVSQGLDALDVLLGKLPSPKQLAILSVGASLLSIWWNPRFVQTYRGFTKHIIGLPLWYTYQTAALSIRVGLLAVLGTSDPDSTLFTAHVALHVLGLGLAAFIYFRGHRSIRIDTAPLFAPSPNPAKYLRRRPDTPRQDEDKNMAQILDEILNTPVSPSNMVSHSKLPDLGSSKSIDTSVSARPRQQSGIQMGSLSLSNSSLVQKNDDEMDWTPTHSKHRAFNTYGERDGQGFNEAPIEPKGPFWYHVPPAPTTPAQRLFNPPNQPLLRKSPVAKENPFARSSGAGAARNSKLWNMDEDEAPQPIKFAEPKFFSQPSQNDPRNSLSDLFGQSFSLSQEEQAEREKAKGWLGGFGFGARSGSGSGPRGKDK